MGGYIAQQARLGRKIVHLVLITSAYRNAKKQFVRPTDRIIDAQNAATALGISYLSVDSTIPENKAGPHLSYIVELIDAWLSEMQPSDVYTCLPWFNEDHNVIHRATLASMRREFRTRFWAYEMPQQNLGYDVPEFGWDYRALTDHDIDQKVLALRSYDHTQGLANKVGPVSVEGAVALAQMRGSEVGLRWAERMLLLRG